MHQLRNGLLVRTFDGCNVAKDEEARTTTKRITSRVVEVDEGRVLATE